MGRITLDYITDNTERRKSRNERKKTLCSKAHELVMRCGGRIIINYIDESDRSFIYSSDDEMFSKFVEVMGVENAKRMWPSPQKPHPTKPNFDYFVVPGESENSSSTDLPSNYDYNYFVIPEPETVSSDAQPVSEASPDSKSSAQASVNGLLPTSLESSSVLASQTPNSASGTSLQENAEDKMELANAVASKAPTSCSSTSPPGLTEDKKESASAPILSDSDQPTASINSVQDKPLPVEPHLPVIIQSQMCQTDHHPSLNPSQTLPQVLAPPAEAASNFFPPPGVQLYAHSTSTPAAPPVILLPGNAPVIPNIPSADFSQPYLHSRLMPPPPASIPAQKTNGKKMKSKVKQTHSKEDTCCFVCKEKYVARKDNKRFGRWVGCENLDECGTWVHRKCIGWSEAQVENDSYYCEYCNGVG